MKLKHRKEKKKKRCLNIPKQPIFLALCAFGDTSPEREESMKEGRKEKKNSSSATPPSSSSSKVPKPTAEVVKEPPRSKGKRPFYLRTDPDLTIHTNSGQAFLLKLAILGLIYLLGMKITK